MLQTILFLILLLAAVAALIALAAGAARRLSARGAPVRLGRRALALGAVLAAALGLVLWSQQSAHTPAIRDASGKPVAGSVAEMRRVTLNGRDEWITLRGWNRNHPVMLFLAGGPGGSQLAAVRHELAELEKHFVVVGWDQPGAGKSFGAAGDISVETYVEDGLALTDWLRSEFGQDRIILLGESWGSALGVFLADRRPEAYRALIGTGQMVAFAETERIDNRLAQALPRRRATIKGPHPPGQRPRPTRPGVAMKSAVYLNYLNGQMNRNPEIQNPGFHTLRDSFPRNTASWTGSISRGIVSTFDRVYPLLYETASGRIIPPRESGILFVGRHDLNAPVELRRILPHPRARKRMGPGLNTPPQPVDQRAGKFSGR
jgi:pimeloyl-ACP methyl ester carboxylesterase